MPTTYQVDVYIRQHRVIVVREETMGRARQAAIRQALQEADIVRSDIIDAVVRDIDPAQHMEG